jgi:putative ABC transport system permease protein
LHTLWHKVRADLWAAKSRSLLAIISIAAGVFCVGTLFGLIDLQLNKMDAAHRQSQPSHINLMLRSDADLALLTNIKALPSVAGVDTLTQLTVHFRRPGESEWTMGTLVVRPDYTGQHFDKTALQTGNWPSAGNIAIENLSVPFSGLNIGDNIEFQTAKGGQTLPITGIVRHPFVKPPKFGGQVHFFADTSTAALFGVSANSFRQLLVQITPPYSSEQARTVAAEISALLAQHHIAVNVTLLQDPEKHWGRPILAGVNGVLQIMALVSLALASVLILNTVSAHIAQQTDQIGVMKALGGATASIAAVYLSEILLMALLAIALAAPPGLAAAYFSSCQLLGLFNIDCGGFEVSSRAILYMLLGGLLAPLLAASGPILKGAAMTVRVAIASYGLGADFGYSRLDLWVERLGARLLPTLHAAALGNLFRRKGRLLLTQSVLIIAGAMFLVLMSLIASLNLTLDNEMARSRFAVRLGFSADQPEQKILDIARSVTATQSAEVWQRLPMEISKDGTTLRQQGSLGAQMLGLPSASAMYAPLIESGRWIQATDAGQRVLVLNADTAQLNGIRAGDKLDIAIGPLKQAWQVIGTYRWLAGGNYAVEPVYAPLETLRNITRRKDMASFALLAAAVNSLAEEADYLRQLKQGFQDHGIQLDVYTTVAKLKQRQFVRNQFNPVLGTLLGLASMIAAVGGIGLSGALAIGVLQRTREIGVLRAIGAPSKSVFRLFLLEGLLHGVVAWALSVPLAYLAAEPVAGELGKTMLGIELDFAFDLKAVFYWLGLVLLLAWLASYWPARQAAGLTVRESLGH